ncbi:glycosyltransferase family 47 protein [Polynucleobacter sp. UK-Kesae-W10]|uniref:glycosyltransferase family 47 protein n=1 Tax=Polynucleobacter sp. UK-Kesae-W10 TaxID=1819738 RepID=UPI001C0E3100|nr:glycosyltransferase family 47 protein [Polynucleobacter sp. UK-Kesae-W10]MBU3576749.1 hypothetical protein [Polynucleobacter sp. UK-Kesae-W10]
MSKYQIISTPDSLNGALETWFIQNDLFAGVPYALGFDPSKVEASTVIYLELIQINLDLIRHLKSLEKKVVLYHMGDERADKEISAYSECDLVIRNYFFDHILAKTGPAKNIMWAPNGFRTGVGPRAADKLKKASSRQSLAAFLGWINNAASFNQERVAFAQAASNCGENLFVLPSGGFAGGYNVGLYSAIMEDSIFAPCPAGNSPETIRLYDALETGSIPISLRHEFLVSTEALGLIGPVPFPILNSWNELPAYLQSMRQKLTSSPQELDDLQARCIAWWVDYKAAIQEKIALRIQSL